MGIIMLLVGRAALLIEVNGLVAGSACNNECTHRGDVTHILTGNVELCHGTSVVISIARVIISKMSTYCQPPVIPLPDLLVC